MQPNSLSAGKSSLRRFARDFRSKLDMADISVHITTQVTSLDAFKDAATILAFYPLVNEVDLRPLFALYPEKSWHLPRVLGENLVFHRVDTDEKGIQNSLIPNQRFKVLEPQENAPVLATESQIDLIFVPGLLFDQAGYRFGYGKGFYDRFLGAPENIDRIKNRVGVIPDELLLPNLSVDAWDLPVDWVVTQNQIIKCGQ